MNSQGSAPPMKREGKHSSKPSPKRNRSEWRCCVEYRFNQPVNVNLSVLIEKSVEKQRSLCFRDWGYE